MIRHLRNQARIAKSGDHIVDEFGHYYIYPESGNEAVCSSKGEMIVCKAYI